MPRKAHRDGAESTQVRRIGPDCFPFRADDPHPRLQCALSEFIEPLAESNYNLDRHRGTWRPFVNKMADRNDPTAACALLFALKRRIEWMDQAVVEADKRHEHDFGLYVDPQWCAASNGQLVLVRIMAAVLRRKLPLTWNQILELLSFSGNKNVRGTGHCRLALGPVLVKTVENAAGKPGFSRNHVAALNELGNMLNPRMAINRRAVYRIDTICANGGRRSRKGYKSIRWA